MTKLERILFAIGCFLFGLCGGGCVNPVGLKAPAAAQDPHPWKVPDWRP